jgi:endonuclease/exonuclease/phosphatase (EEP) superfamily protein YafD
VSDPATDTPSRRRRLFRLLRITSVIVVTVLLVLGLLGHLVRDRTVWLAALMYIPILPLGLMAVLLAVLPRRQSYRTRLPGLLGLVAIALSVSAMIETRPRPQSSPASARPVTLLHWNVWWGGEWEGWDDTVSDIVRRAPDVVVLSEGPTAKKQERLRETLGQDWSAVSWESPAGARYRFKLVVLSRWPLRIDAQQDITDGKAMTASVTTDAGELRVLVVDGKSNWYLSRTPRLHDVALICDSARQSGRPIDVIAGDFNCVGRSIGFDAFEEAGYALASRASGEWRGTWPAPLPLYDLDHVWVRREVSVIDCDLFGNSHTDHRGQVVRFATPGR